MKVRSNIKAGGLDTQNHNEKVMENNNGSIKRRKSLSKKLNLQKEIIRELKESDLRQIAGGASSTSLRGCDPSSINHNEKIIKVKQ